MNDFSENGLYDSVKLLDVLTGLSMREIKRTFEFRWGRRK